MHKEIIDRLQKWSADCEDAKTWGGPTIYPPFPFTLAEIKSMAKYLPSEKPEGWLVRAVGDTKWNFWDEDPMLDENIGGGDLSRFEIKPLFADARAEAVVKASADESYAMNSEIFGLKDRVAVAEAERDAAIARADRLEAALTEAIEHYIGSVHAQSNDGHCDIVEDFANVKRWRAALAPTP